MAEVGPDGAVWVIDWYNFVVQHNPTPQGFKTGKGAAYETDQVLVDALTSAAASHAVPYLESVLSSQIKEPSAATLRIVERVTEHVARARPDAESLQKIVSGLSNTSIPASAAVLDGLASGLPSDFRVSDIKLLDMALVAAFEKIKTIELVKGDDDSAPIMMALTIERTRDRKDAN